MTAWDLADCNGPRLVRLVNDSLDRHEIESEALAFNFHPRAIDGSSDGDNGGSGLGLRTAKAIVERPGGQIGFQAGSDTGTTLFSGQPE
jgi:K+-sensing histidine kinase KdpD